MRDGSRGSPCAGFHEGFRLGAEVSAFRDHRPEVQLFGKRIRFAQAYGACARPQHVIPTSPSKLAFVSEAVRLPERQTAHRLEPTRAPLQPPKAQAQRAIGSNGRPVLSEEGGGKAGEAHPPAWQTPHGTSRHARTDRPTCPAWGTPPAPPIVAPQDASKERSDTGSRTP